MAKSIKQLRYEYSCLLEQMNDNLRKQIEVLDRTQYGPGDGAVYVLRQIGTNNYKIGHTTNYQQRKQQLDVRLPFEVEEVYVYKTDNYRTVEAKLHQNYAAHRLNGSEFFELSNQTIEELPDLTFQIDRAIELEKAKQDNGTSQSLIDADEEMMQRAEALLEEEGISKKDVSTSFLQRKLRIGYSRAARLNDTLKIG